jgi:hypothetical protein
MIKFAGIDAHNCHADRRDGEIRLVSTTSSSGIGLARGAPLMLMMHQTVDWVRSICGQPLKRLLLSVASFYAGAMGPDQAGSTAMTGADRGQLSSPNLFLRRAVGFWSGLDRSSAWLWTAGAILLISPISPSTSESIVWFFDALEGKKCWRGRAPYLEATPGLLAHGVHCGNKQGQ